MAMLFTIGCLTLAITACDDDEGDGFVDNQIKFRGETLGITGGYQDYYGLTWPSETSRNVSLYIVVDDPNDIIVNEDDEIMIEMYIPMANDRLIAGTYTFEGLGEKDHMMFDDTSLMGEFTEGTIKVAVSGSTYTITFDLVVMYLEDQDDDGIDEEVEYEFKGKFVGELPWTDKSMG